MPEDERLDYLKAILTCARAKGQLTDGERDWVIGYGAACGAPQETVDALEAYAADEDLDDILGRNQTAASQWGRVAVFDAIRAAAGDHEYDDDEKQAIRQVAGLLDVDDDVVADLEALSQEEQDLKRRRVALVFGRDVPYQDGA